MRHKSLKKKNKWLANLWKIYENLIASRNLKESILRVMSPP